MLCPVDKSIFFMKSVHVRGEVGTNAIKNETHNIYFIIIIGTKLCTFSIHAIGIRAYKSVQVFLELPTWEITYIHTYIHVCM
jgi:hypothetical protein